MRKSKSAIVRKYKSVKKGTQKKDAKKGCKKRTQKKMRNKDAEKGKKRSHTKNMIKRRKKDTGLGLELSVASHRSLSG